MNINNLKGLLTLGMRATDRKKVCEPLITFAEVKPPFQARELCRYPFRHSSCGEAGVQPGYIASFIRELRDERSIGIQSILILKDGKLIADAAFGPYRTDIWKNTFSECKSVTGIAIGLLYDEGKLTPEERLVDIFPGQVSTLQKLVIGSMTVRHLLTMTSQVCFNEGESMTSENWVKSFLSSTLRGQIGSEFNYNSLNSFMLSAIVREKTGMSLSDYLREKLFNQMGIEDFYWEKSPEGIEKGGWGLYILPEDMLKLGELLRCRGEWKGKRLLSEEWIELMTTGYEAAPSTAGYFRYGFQMWVGKDNGAWLFNGMFGQNMLIYPETGYVIVSNASNTDMFQQGAYFPLCDSYFSKMPEREYPDSQEELEELIASLVPHERVPEKRKWWSFFKKEKPVSRIPPDAMLFAGKRLVPVKKDYALGVMPRMMQGVQNDYTPGLDCVRLDADVPSETMTVTFCEGTAKYTFPMDFSVPVESALAIGRSVWQVALACRTARNEDGEAVLILDFSFLEMPFTRSMRFTLHNDGSVTLRAYEKPGKAFITRFASTMGVELVRNPVVEATIAKFDMDYVDYKLESLFQPSLEMKEEHGIKTLGLEKNLPAAVSTAPLPRD